MGWKLASSRAVARVSEASGPARPARAPSRRRSRCSSAGAWTCGMGGARAVAPGGRSRQASRERTRKPPRKAARSAGISRAADGRPTTRAEAPDAAQSPPVGTAQIPKAEDDSRGCPCERVLAPMREASRAKRLFAGLVMVYAAPSAASASDAAMAPWLLAAAVVGALLTLAGVALSQQRRTRADRGRLQLALGAAASWTWRTSPEGVVVEAERGHRVVDWFDCAALVGRRPWEIEPGANAPPALAEALNARGPFFDVRLDIDGLTPAATPRVLAISGVPVFAAAGTFAGYVGAVHDLTPLLAHLAAAHPEEVDQLRADLQQRTRQLFVLGLARPARAAARGRRLCHDRARGLWRPRQATRRSRARPPAPNRCRQPAHELDDRDAAVAVPHDQPRTDPRAGRSIPDRARTGR